MSLDDPPNDPPQGLIQSPHVPPPHVSESRTLEIVVTCVGFDDVLDVTLGLNHGQADSYIVVTKHSDKATQSVCKKHSARCVCTDMFEKNGRKFNKGAAINAGFDHFQYFGWRLHLDVDIVLPDNFRRVLFNHCGLDQRCIYGADRVDVIGLAELNDILLKARQLPQHAYMSGINPIASRPISPRFVDQLRGYCPIGFFQLWNAVAHKPYPYSLGTAAHDDVMFSQSWSEKYRHLLPGVIVYHLVPDADFNYYGANWEGRRSKRL